MQVDVYTLPNCQGCRATFRRLDRSGVRYTIHHLADGAVLPDGVEAIQAPVVVHEGGYHSGYSPDKLDALATRVLA